MIQAHRNPHRNVVTQDADSVMIDYEITDGDIALVSTTVSFEQGAIDYALPTSAMTSYDVPLNELEAEDIVSADGFMVDADAEITNEPSALQDTRLLATARGPEANGPGTFTTRARPATTS